MMSYLWIWGPAGDANTGGCLTLRLASKRKGNAATRNVPSTGGELVAKDVVLVILCCVGLFVFRPWEACEIL